MRISLNPGFAAAPPLAKGEPVVSTLCQGKHRIRSLRVRNEIRWKEAKGGQFHWLAGGCFCRNI